MENNMDIRDMVYNLFCTKLDSFRIKTRNVFKKWIALIGEII